MQQEMEFQLKVKCKTVVFKSILFILYILQKSKQNKSFQYYVVMLNYTVLKERNSPT